MVTVAKKLFQDPILLTTLIKKMRMKRIITLLLFLLPLLAGYAQNPFAAYGYKPKMATLSNGRFDEFHDKNQIVEIGSIKFDTKTNKIVGLVEPDTLNTAMDVQTVSRFVSIDPHAERYYSISPYAYCNNNPIKYVDPDGKDIVIWFQNENGKQISFTFNGQNGTSAPNNSFVSSVIAAYDYNVKNGGGKNLKAIATSDKFNVGVVETNYDNRYQSGFIRFNPNAGLQLNDGYILSPATGLEHEAAHGVNDKTGKKNPTRDLRYDTKEERSIITGAELETAKANGELPKNHKGRSSHAEGEWVVTKSSTSNQELDKRSSNELRNRINRFKNSWTSE